MSLRFSLLFVTGVTGVATAVMGTEATAHADGEPARRALAATSPKLTLSFALPAYDAGDELLETPRDRSDRLCLGAGDCPLTRALLTAKDPGPAYHGPSPGKASARFIASLGPGPAAVLAWFVPPIPKVGGLSIRFAPLFAVGGAALGLRCRW